MKHVNLTTVIYFLVAIIFGVNKINPSDPLEYIIPIYNDGVIFPYLDRITLANFLKLLFFLRLDPDNLSWIAPSSINVIIYFISSRYVLQRSNFRNVYLFLILSLISPFNISTFTYLYPTTLMLLFFIIGILIINKYKTGTAIGFFLPFIFLTKIQGISLIFNILIRRKDFKIDKFLIGAILGTVSIYVATSILFNDFYYIIKISKSYFSENFTGQISGYGGNMPPFEMYIFEPFIFFIICQIIFFWKKFEQEEKLFIEVSFFQFLFLILIYYLTQRGGALIPNYIAPVIFLLTIPIAIKIPYKIFFNKSFLIFFVTIYFASLAALYNSAGKQYFATENRLAELIGVILVIILWYIDYSKFKKFWIFYSLIISSLFSYKAQSENISRVIWSTPFQEAFSTTKNLNKKIYYNFLNDEILTKRFKMLEDVTKDDDFGFCSTNCKLENIFFTNSISHFFEYYENSIYKNRIECNKNNEALTCQIANHNSIRQITVDEINKYLNIQRSHKYLILIADNISDECIEKQDTKIYDYKTNLTYSNIIGINEKCEHTFSFNFYILSEYRNYGQYYLIGILSALTSER